MVQPSGGDMDMDMDKDMDMDILFISLGLPGPLGHINITMYPLCETSGSIVVVVK